MSAAGQLERWLVTCQKILSKLVPYTQHHLVKSVPSRDEGSGPHLVSLQDWDQMSLLQTTTRLIRLFLYRS